MRFSAKFVTSLGLLSIVYMLFSLSSSAYAAGTLVKPNWLNSATSTHSYPFYASNHCKWQHIIDKKSLTFGPATITELGFYFRNRTFTATYSSVEIWLGESTKTGSSVSRTFTANYVTGTATKVYDGALTLTSNSSNDYLPRVVLQSAFNFSGNNHILVEFRKKHSGRPTLSGTTPYHSRSTSSSIGFGTYMYNSSSSTATTGNGPYYYGNFGYSFIIETGEELTWTGSTSSSWNDKTNWSPAQVPTDSDEVTIPDGATTTNDPTLPSNAECKDIILASGAILNGGTGRIDVYGDWTSTGTFNKGTATVQFSDSGEQTVDQPGNDFHILAAGDGRLNIKQPITAANTGTVICYSKGEIAFDGNSVDLSGIALTNSGKLVFGGSGNDQVITTDTNHALKSVIIDSPGSSDSVTFNGTQNFTTLSITGNGDVTFANAISFSSSFTTDAGSSASLTTPSITGTGDMTLDQSHSLTVPFSIGTNDISYTGSGTTVLTGNHPGYIEHDGFGSLTITGNVTNGDFDYTGSGSLRITGNFDGNSFWHDGSGSVTITGDFDGDDIWLDGSGDLTIEGEVTTGTLEILGSSVFTAEDDASADSLVHEGTGVLLFEGDFTLDDDMVLEPDQGLGTLVVDGDLTVEGELEIKPSVQANQNSLTVNGTATFDGGATFTQSNARFLGAFVIDGDVSFANSAKVSFDNPTGTTLAKLTMSNDSVLNASGDVTVTGLITLNDSAEINVADGLSVGFHINHNSKKAIVVGGIFEVDGSSTAVPITLNLGDDVECNRAILDASNGVKLTGRIVTASIAKASPAVTVTAGTTLEMVDDSKLSVDAGYVNIDGGLVTTAGELGLAPKIIGGGGPDEHATVAFGATAVIDIDRMTFQKVGKDTEPYAVTVANGAKITKFEYVTIAESASTVAVFDLDTSDVVSVIDNLWIAGTSPLNFDAFDVHGITITFNLKTHGGGNLYGVEYEQDPQKLLFWDASAVVLIQGNEKLPPMYVDRDNSYFIQAIGGNAPYIYSLENHPTWMSVNQLTGEITGSAPENEVGVDYTFDVLVGDSTEVGFPPVPLAPVRRTFKYDVEIPPYFAIEFTTDSELPDATADVAYSTQIDIIEGRKPFVFELLGAQEWLNIDAATGEISGTPPLLFEGPVSFTVSVSDSNTEAPAVTKLFTIDVQSSGYTPIQLTSASDLGFVIEGNSFSETLSIEHGVAPHTFAFSSQPEWIGHESDPEVAPHNWITLDAATGEISGTAPLGEYGEIGFTIQVSDQRAGSPVATKSFIYEVREIPYDPIVFDTQALLPDAAQGQEFSHTLQISDGRPAYLFSLISAPVWLRIDAVTGEITGIPPSTFSGYLNFTVGVSDQKFSVPVTKDFSLQVIRVGDNPLLVDTPPILFQAEAGTSYHISLAASGGSGEGFSWELRDGHYLPEGLTLNPVTGVISGTPLPSAGGEYVFDVRVVDSMGAESFQTLALTVGEPDIGDFGLNDNVTAGSLPDRGPAGGCAVQGGSNLWILAMIMMLGGLMALRSTRRSEA